MKTLRKIREEQTKLMKKYPEAKGMPLDMLSNVRDAGLKLMVLEIQTRGVISLIKKEIKFCESKSKGTFEEDKIWNWRIDGFQALIKKIKGENFR